MNNSIRISLATEDDHTAQDAASKATVETANADWNEAGQRRAEQVAGSRDKADAILAWAKQPGAMDDETRAAVGADLGSHDPARRDNAMVYLRERFNAQAEQDIRNAGGFTSSKAMHEAMQRDRQQHGDITASTRARIAATPGSIVSGLRL